MARRRGQDEHQVHVRRGEQLAVVGDEAAHAELVHDQVALGRPAAGGHHLGLAAQRQPLGLRPVGAEHVAAADDADADRVHGRASTGPRRSGRILMLRNQTGSP